VTPLTFALMAVIIGSVLYHAWALDRHERKVQRIAEYQVMFNVHVISDLTKLFRNDQILEARILGAPDKSEPA